MKTNNKWISSIKYWKWGIRRIIGNICLNTWLRRHHDLDMSVSLEVGMIGRLNSLSIMTIIIVIMQSLSNWNQESICISLLLMMNGSVQMNIPRITIYLEISIITLSLTDQCYYQFGLYYMIWLYDYS